ncbi:hypothetical protein REPUB_Repub12eG0024100 [Reevesia pubescens]
MKEIMVEKGYEKVVGFVPTGWTYEVKRNKFSVRSKDTFEIHVVPYSEHSNYNELREYVKFLKPNKVIPTVSMDIQKLDSKNADKLRKHFDGLVDEMANKKDFLMGFNRANCENVEKSEMDASGGLNEKRTWRESKIYYSTIPSEEERERIIEEFGNVLLKWVTRDQILDLISSLRWNIVEAVSNFYERENELFEQFSAFRTSNSASQASSSNNFVSLSNLGPFKSNTSQSSVSKNEHVPEKSRCMVDSSLQRQEVGNVNTTLVSLPPDKYKPIEHACWRSGQSASYIHLAQTFNLVGGQKGKIKATYMLCNMFRSLLALSTEDVLPTIDMCTNKIAAEHENNELNIGRSLVTSALEEACGTTRSKIRDMHNEIGDLGRSR